MTKLDQPIDSVRFLILWLKCTYASITIYTKHLQIARESFFRITNLVTMKLNSKMPMTLLANDFLAQFLQCLPNRPYETSVYLRSRIHPCFNKLTQLISFPLPDQTHFQCNR